MRFVIVAILLGLSVTGRAESLPQADAAVAKAYRALLSQAGPERTSVMLLQRAWMQDRSRVCRGDVACRLVHDRAWLGWLRAESFSASQGNGLGPTFAKEVVNQAFTLLPDHWHSAETIFRAHDGVVSKVGLAVVLRLSMPNSRAHDSEIKQMLADVDRAADRLPVDLPDTYDGSIGALIPYLRAAGGQIELSCRLLQRFSQLLDTLHSEFGTSQDAFLPFARCDHRDFPIPASVGELSKAVFAYSGDAFGRCTGTMRSGYSREFMRDEVERQVFPRALLNDPVTNERPLARDILDHTARTVAPGWTRLDETPLRQWSLQDPWSRRAYLRLRHRFFAARTDLASYYRRIFGLPPRQALLAAHIGLWLDLERWAWLPPTPANEINAAIMDPGAKPSLATLLGQRVRPDSTASEPALSLAVIRPETIAPLLVAGAHVDLVDVMGKTPLMFAAQLNQLDAARQLLRAGAPVNDTTFAPEATARNDPPDPNNQWAGCGFYAITHGERTALMYAAANGSRPMIHLLLAAGADASLADSKGSTALDYLTGKGPVAANPLLHGRDLVMAKAWLTVPLRSPRQH